MAKGKRANKPQNPPTRLQPQRQANRGRTDDRDEGGGPSQAPTQRRGDSPTDADINARGSQRSSTELLYGPVLPNTAVIPPAISNSGRPLGHTSQFQPREAGWLNPWESLPFGAGQWGSLEPSVPGNSLPGQFQAGTRGEDREPPSIARLRESLLSRASKGSTDPSNTRGDDPRDSPPARRTGQRPDTSDNRSTVSAERRHLDEEAVLQQLEIMDQGVHEALDAGRNAAQVARDTIQAAERIALRNAAARQRIIYHLKRMTGPPGPLPDFDNVNLDPRAQVLAGAAQNLVDVAEERRRWTADYVRRYRSDVLTPSERNQINDLANRETLQRGKDPPPGAPRRPDHQARGTHYGRNQVRQAPLGHTRGDGEPPDDDRSSSGSPPPRNDESLRPQVDDSRPTMGRSSWERDTHFPRSSGNPDVGRGPHDRIEQLLARAFRASNSVDDGPQLTKLGIKVPLPEAYDGTSDLELFENWLAQLVGWFQIYNLDVDSREMDRVRLQILGQQLKGRASNYFQRRSEESSRGEGPWTFVIAVRKLRDRFLYKATALDAAFKFENLMQGGRDVETLADDLNRYAERMTEPPAPYQIRRRFMQALKTDVAKWLISNQITPESHSLKDIVTAAKAVEESERYNRGFHLSRANLPPRPPQVPPRDNKGKAPFKPSHRPNGPQRPFVGNSARMEQSGAPTRAPFTTNKPEGAGSRPTAGNSMPPRESRPPEANPKRGGPPPPQQSRGGCYVCGSRDHWADYHKRQNPRGFAAQVIEEDDQDKNTPMDVPREDVPDEPHEEIHVDDQEGAPDGHDEEPLDENPEGNQYDPDEYLEQYRWSDIEDDEHGYGARLVPVGDLDEVGEPLPIRVMAAKVAPPKEVPLLNSQARRSLAQVAPQPERDPKAQRTINVLIDIGGIEADVLIDSGSTTNMMAPNFARIASTRAVELQIQMGLRLAVKGSGSKLNYGAWAQVTMDHIKVDEYFDIVNLDRHDVVLGTPFLWANGVSPIFEGDGYLQCRGRQLDIPVLPCRSEAKSKVKDQPPGPSFPKNKGN
jgi:hypothetical protein